MQMFAIRDVIIVLLNKLIRHLNIHTSFYSTPRPSVPKRPVYFSFVNSLPYPSVLCYPHTKCADPLVILIFIPNPLPCLLSDFGILLPESTRRFPSLDFFKHRAKGPFPTAMFYLCIILFFLDVFLQKYISIYLLLVYVNNSLYLHISILAICIYQYSYACLY